MNTDHNGKARTLKMKKSNQLKAQLTELDDAALQSLIYNLAASAGISAERISSLTGNVPALRKALSKMDDEQITALINTLGGGANVNGK